MGSEAEAGENRIDGRVEFDGLSLATARWGRGPIEIVLLHDGLGSIAQWRSVPARVHETLGCGVLAYERAGHGTSTPVPSGPWPPDWLHREAAVFDRLLDALGIDRPLVVGHSDGGSTALIHAATTSDRTAGLLAIAPHSWVEDLCHDSIVAMRGERARFEAGLAHFHDAPAEVFEAWSGVWVSDAFRSWDIRPMLAAIDVPCVITQGEVDGYASDEHVVSTAEAIGDNATWRLLPGLGHIAHHDDPEAIVDLIVGVYRQLGV